MKTSKLPEPQFPYLPKGPGVGGMAPISQGQDRIRQSLWNPVMLPLPCVPGNNQRNQPGDSPKERSPPGCRDTDILIREHCPLTFRSSVFGTTFHQIPLLPPALPLPGVLAWRVAGEPQGRGAVKMPVPNWSQPTSQRKDWNFPLQKQSVVRRTLTIVSKVSKM
jgi:hypothetical protein